MTKVKICGLKREEDILCVNELLPDFIGFVFAGSSRQVTEDAAFLLKERLHTGISSVGVFVNEKPDQILRICSRGILDLVQLHGEEDASYIEEIKQATGLPVVKAVRVRSTEQILKAQELPCDYLLLDTCTKGQYGGSGQTFERSLIPALSKPYFLAGGLNPGNVGDAVGELRPYAVDVSSAVESDGVKDKIKIKEFIERVREYE